MLKNNQLHIFDCVSNLLIYTTITHGTTPQLYIIPQKSDILSGAVRLDTDFLGRLNTHIENFSFNLRFYKRTYCHIRE